HAAAEPRSGTRRSPIVKPATIGERGTYRCAAAPPRAPAIDPRPTIRSNLEERKGGYLDRTHPLRSQEVSRSRQGGSQTRSSRIGATQPEICSPRSSHETASR